MVNTKRLGKAVLCWTIRGGGFFFGGGNLLFEGGATGINWCLSGFLRIDGGVSCCVEDEYLK